MKNCFFFVFLVPFFLFSKPHGAHTIAGDAHFSEPDSKTLEIRTGHRTIIQWKDFSIESGECAKFIQPGQHAAVLNRVSGNVLSRIDGLLQANGKVYLLNANGILIGKQGVIQTAEFVGSTLDVLDSSFLKDESLIYFGDSTASLVNYGTIQALDGDINLFAKTISNHGSIIAKDGNVTLAAASEIVLQTDGQEGIFIIPSSEGLKKMQSGIENNGVIEAITARLIADGNAYGLAICQKGQIEAINIRESNGRIYLVADQGTVEVAGSLRAPAGTITVHGDKIGVLENAVLDVSGDFAAGEIFIGEKEKTELAVIEKNTTFDASCNLAGDGGQVIVWSEGATAFAGEILADAGHAWGDGGFVEVSGKKHLNFTGLVTTNAPAGKMGTLLLDPTDVTISSSGDVNNMFAGGNYTYSAGTANINNTTLMTNLGGSNVTITTNSPFFAPAGGTITVSAAVTWPGSTNLSLFAANNIAVNAGITNTGAGSLSLNAQNNITVSGTAVGTFTLETVGGSMTLNAGSSIFLQPTGANAVTIPPPFAGLTINTGQDLQMLGGSMANNFVELFAAVGPNSISIGRNLILTAGTGSNTFSQIAAAPNATSAIQIAVGQNLQLTGGSGGAGQNFAAIGGSAVGPGIFSPIDLAVGGNATVLGGSGLNAFAQIGHFPSSASSITTINANMNVAVAGSLIVTGGGGANDSAIVGTGNVASGLASEALAGTISVGAGQISLTGGSSIGAIAEIGFISSATTTVVMPASVNVSGEGGISLLGGTGDSAIIGYDATLSSTTLDVAVPVNVTTNGLLQMNAPGLGEAVITNNRSGVQAPANVNIQFGNGLIGTQAGPPGNVQLYSSQDLIVIANQSMTLGNISNTHSVAGQISLVVDNANTDTGQFIKDFGATVTTSGPLRIFTVDRKLTSIQGLLNGVTFVPGPLFIDSNTERWGVSFFDPFGGFPFTIFYKNELPAYQNAYGIAISEALRDIKVYDELIFVRIPIYLCYDVENYSRPRRTLSGYDFAEDEEYDMLRQRYRNYNTKYSESL